MIENEIKNILKKSLLELIDEESGICRKILDKIALDGEFDLKKERDNYLQTENIELKIKMSTLEKEMDKISLFESEILRLLKLLRDKDKEIDSLKEQKISLENENKILKRDLNIALIENISAKE